MDRSLEPATHKWVLVRWTQGKWEIWQTREWTNYTGAMPNTTIREVAQSNSIRELQALMKLLYASEEGR